MAAGGGLENRTGFPGSSAKRIACLPPPSGINNTIAPRMGGPPWDRQFLLVNELSQVVGRLQNYSGKGVNALQNEKLTVSIDGPQVSTRGDFCQKRVMPCLFL